MSVYLVDNNAAVRDALSLAFASRGMNLVALESLEQLIAEVRNDEPSCLILDPDLPGRSGLDWLRDSKFQGKVRMPVIILASTAALDDVAQSMKLGAIDFLIKPAEIALLVDRASNGLRIDAQRIEHEKERRKIVELCGQISDREWNVVALMCEGYSSKQIARKLKISTNTVSNHRARLRQKTGAVNTAELIRLVMLADVERQRRIAS